MRNTIDSFEHFVVEYKIITWIVFLIAGALAWLCIWVWFLINGTPTIFFNIARHTGRLQTGSPFIETIAARILEAITSTKWTSSQAKNY